MKVYKVNPKESLISWANPKESLIPWFDPKDSLISCSKPHLFPPTNGKIQQSSVDGGARVN